MVRIDNYTKNDIFLPVLGTKTKTKRVPLTEVLEVKQGSKAVKREVLARDEHNNVIMQDIEEAYESVVGTVHVPPKLTKTKLQDASVEVTNDVAETMKTLPAVQKLIEADSIRFTSLA